MDSELILSSSEVKNFLRDTEEKRPDVIFRPGHPDDVLEHHHHQNEKCVDEFVAEYSREEFNADLQIDEYEIDPRIEAKFEIIEGQENIKESRYLAIKVHLPDEDGRTIDIDVKDDKKLLIFSHQFKAKISLPKSVFSDSAKTTFDNNNCMLIVRINTK